ncbi:MAG: FAD-dependent oxidoreductase [Planctomycetota bacterium]
MKIAILGAGVTGLALARFLVEEGVELASLSIFEAAPVAGGLCRSKSVGGFTYDVAGGHILFSKDTAAMDWMKRRAGGDEAFCQRDRNTKIRFGDAWVHYPFENGLGDLPERARFECLAGYVRAWHDRTNADGSPRTQAPGDFASWIRWRFGDGIAEHFMDPYNEKIWKRPLRDITSEWVAGRVPDAPIEDVLKSAVGIRTEGYVHQSIFYYPLHGGFQAITDGLAAELGDRVRTSTPVQHVARRGEGFTVDGEEFDAVINTLPLDLLPDVVEGLDDGAADAMRALEYNAVTCVLVALDRPDQPNLSWIYLPHPQQGPANRVTYMSNYSPNNAPEGQSSLMAEVTSDGRGEAPGPEVADLTVEGLARAGLLVRENVLFTDVHTSKHAYVVYDHGFAEKRAAAIAGIEELGLTTIGRFGRYDYDNSDQCVIKARALATELAAAWERGRG